MRWTEHYLPEIVLGTTFGGAAAVNVVIYAVRGISPYSTIAWDIATLLAVSTYFTVRRSRRDPQAFLREMVVIGVVLAAVSIFTGIGNGATDEGYTTPLYGNMMVSLVNPYWHLLTVPYTVHYGPFISYRVISTSYDTYLPLISFLQIPGTGILGYELLCVAAWLGLVYLVRKDEFASLTLASPVIALLAANGFNDLPVLFLMTLSLRGWSGPKAKVVEYLTYGMKQFANVFWFAFYLIQRRWVGATLVLVISAVWVLPFLLWPGEGSGIYCQALTLGWGPGCAGVSSGVRGVADLWDHWNYYAWPVWAYALFRSRIDRWWGTARLRLARRRPSKASVADG